MFKLQFMIEKPTPDVLTLPTTFYDLSVSRNLFAKAEMPQFGTSGTEGLNNILNLLNLKIQKIKFLVKKNNLKKKVFRRIS